MISHLLLLAAVQTGPVPHNEGEWIGLADYPEAALRYDQQGTVAVTLDVDSEGRVDRCSVTESSGFEALDSRTCALLLERARFAPARDEGGRAVPGSFLHRVEWRLAARPLLPLEPWSQTSRVGIAGDGSILSCSTRDSGTVPAINGDFCDLATEFPVEARLLMRGGPGPQPATVHLQISMSFDGTEAFPAEHVVPGRTVTSLISSRFDIDEQGRAQNCRIIEQSGEPLLHPQICRNMYDGPFIPDRDTQGAPRRRIATVLLSYSVEQAGAAPR